MVISGNQLEYDQRYYYRGRRFGINCSTIQFLIHFFPKKKNNLILVIRSYEVSMESMSRLNRNAARLMHKYGAHGATDITGFGIMGHSTNLVKNQKANVNFEIHTLPIIKKMKEIDEKVQIFSLMKGYSSETSGGLFIGLPAEKAEAFCQELQQLDGQPAWIIGRVLKSDQNRSHNHSYIIENPILIEV